MYRLSHIVIFSVYKSPSNYITRKKSTKQTFSIKYNDCNRDAPNKTKINPTEQQSH